MSARSVIQVTLWNSPYLGNFMSSELVFAKAVRERLGLETHFVLDYGAAGQPWLSDLDAAGTTWSVFPGTTRAWRAHLAAVSGEHDAALLHTHFTAADLYAASVAHRMRVPCLWHIRTGFNGYPPRQRAKDLIKMRLVARRRVDRILAVSPWLGEFARRRGAPADRVEVVPNPTVFDRFLELPSREAARERFGLDPSATVVLALGWWPEVKGVDVLLDAIGLLAPRRPELQVLLVGEEKMRPFLQERPGPQPPWLHTSKFVSDAAWLFAAADVFVSASRHEGQSSAIGEALACGLPVVMSDIAGTRSWGAAPHVNVFASEDPHALARSMEGLLAKTPEDRRTLGAENREWTRVHAGVEIWCDRLCSIYESLLSGRELTPSSGAPGKSPSYEPEVLDGQLAQGE